MPFESISTIHILVGALTLSFIFAMIWTNIQKSALSKFINHLCDNNIFCAENAVTLKEIGLSGLSASIISRSAEKKFGLGKVTSVIYAKQSMDKLEALLEGSKEDKYFLLDTDTEALKKKYSYSPLSLKYMLLFVVALIVTAIVSTVIVEFLVSNHMSQKVTTNKENQKEEISDQINEADDKNGKEDAKQTENHGPSIPL